PPSSPLPARGRTSRGRRRAGRSCAGRRRYRGAGAPPSRRWPREVGRQVLPMAARDPADLVPSSLTSFWTVSAVSAHLWHGMRLHGFVTILDSAYRQAGESAQDLEIREGRFRKRSIRI